MVIACIDFSNSGHRMHLMCSVLKSIVSTGNTAICITNDTESIMQWMQNNYTGENNKIYYYTYQYVPPTEIHWNQKIHDIYIAWQYWKQYDLLLKKIEKKYQLKIDAVLFNYIDVFLSCLFPKLLQKIVFNYRWFGLYIHTRYMRKFRHLGVQHKKSAITDIDYILKSDRCLGVGIFDAGIQSDLEYRLDKKVTLMPDVTDVSTNTTNYELTNEIKQKAADRIIIGCIGISYYTGVIDLIKLANACTGKNYFFVFCGQFDEGSYKHIPKIDDRTLLSQFRNNPPENCLWREGYLQDEFEYNAVFNSLDIIYMMYPEHYTSSNRLTKAAYFGKPVLAANQHCVGENVQKFKLGEVAAPGDIVEQLEKLNKLAVLLKSEKLPLSSWKDYYLLNNDESFHKQLKSLIGI